MEIKITISKEELINLIKKHYNIDGDVKFIIKKEQYKSGYCEGIQHYSYNHIFNGVEVIDTKQK